MAKQAGTEPVSSSLPLGLTNNAGELEVLRDLIFGNQARDFTRRLTDLDGRLEVVRRELKAEGDSRAQSVAKTAADQTSTLRKETNSRVDKEVRMLGERLEQLSADFYEHMESMRRALETRLDRLQEDSGERMRLIEEDARQRDDELRTELLTVSAWLEDKKTSREALGRMLEEMGQRLQASAPNATTAPEKS
jgi:DNA anti-recombination protein RmuC